MSNTVGNDSGVRSVEPDRDLPESTDLAGEPTPTPARPGANSPAWDLQETAKRMKQELSKGVNLAKHLTEQSPSLADVQEGKAKLDLGDHGPAVEHLQKLLGMTPSGVFDPSTKAAVQSFQKSSGLKPATGEVGQTTLNALEATRSPSLADIYGGNAKLNPGDRGQAVDHVQKMLNMKPTGVFDSATQAAVQKFQEAHGLHPATGQVGQTTLNALDVAHSPSLADLHQGNRKLELGDKGQAVDHVQKLLDMKPTGEFGPTTKAAVQKFQEAHGLHPATGEVGKQTLDAMEAAHREKDLFGASRDLKLSQSHADALVEGGTHDPGRLEKVPTNSAIVRDAQKYMGTQYGWGCKNPEQDGKVDCSGLVDKVYADNHIKLPAGWANDTTKDPSQDPSICDNEYMKHVDPGQAKPGDVVIFGNRHIGIYVGDVTDKDGKKVPMYIGANHGDRSANSTGRVDLMPVSSYPGVIPQFYHPTPKAMGV